jgi:hypothetical protein
MGPLLAGLSGFGWAMLPPFVSIFVLWLVVLRPQQWPQSTAEWMTRSAWLAAISQVLSQTLLVAVCFGIGRGIGGVLGYVPLLQPLLPVALSFGALTLARLFWSPERALAEDLSIDELMYPVAQPPVIMQPQPLTGEAVAELLALTDEAPLEEAGPLLEDVLEDADTFARLSALVEALSAAPAGRHRALRSALILWATEPATFAAGTAPGAMRAAFAAAGQDADLLRLLVPRAAALSRAVPKRADQFPDPAVIDDIARRGTPADLAETLASLAQALRRGPATGDRKAPSQARAKPGGLQQA